MFVLSVLSLHFTGMGALTLTPDPTLPAPANVVDHTGLALMVTAGAVGLLVAGGVFSYIDRRAAAAKLAAATRMHRLADAALEGLVIHDGETVLDVNAAITTMLGCEAEELVGAPLHQFVAPDSRRPLEEAARGERAYPVEATLIGPRGLIEVEIHRRTLSDGVFVAAIRDSAMRRRAERAEKADTAKSQFLANMSHELRTPLNAIIGYSEMIVEESGENDTVADASRILASAKHLLALLNEVLDLSKIEAGRMEMLIEDCPPRAILQEVRDTMYAAAAAKGLEIRIEAEEVGLVRADCFRLKQCLLNLVANAIKFSDPGVITISVRATADRRATFAVADTGIGMNEEQVARLFSDYMQADATVARKFGGTGLGLAITKRLAGLMNGQVAVTSREGVGSTFSITLPAPSAVMSRASVLVIDDDADAAAIIVRALDAVGVSTRVAQDGARGLELALATRPDVVVLDIRLLDMSGWDVLARLRARGGPPVVVHSIEDVRRRAVAAGAIAAFQKPAPREALVAAILRVVGSVHARVRVRALS